MESRFKISIILEYFFIMLFICFLLWAGLGDLWAHRISHDYPIGYLASDTFLHQTRAQAIVNAGNYKLEAFYISKGFHDAIGGYPPILFYLGDMLSISSGLKVYDGIFLVPFLFTVLGIIALYFIIKKYNKNVAVLAIPLTIFIFLTNTYIAFTWGHWPAIISSAFLTGAIWSVTKLESKLGFIVFGIFVAGIMMSHTPELIFLVLFLFFYLVIKLLLKKFDLKELFEIAKGGILALIISFYYLIIFRFTWMVVQPYQFHVTPTWVANPGFYLYRQYGTFEFFKSANGDHFPHLFLIIILIGLIVGILSLIKTMNIVPVIGISMLILGFTNYVGFDWRAFQLRFFWPVYLSILFGLGIYYILKFILKKWNFAISILISMVLLIVIILNSNLLPANTSLMDPYHWQALIWLKNNTAENSTLYFLYGDIYSQDAVLRNTEREHYLINTDDFFQSLSNGTIKRYYKTKFPGDGSLMMTYRKSLFSYGYHAKEYSMDYFYGERDLCAFDYYIIDKYLADRANNRMVENQYNLAVKEKFLKNGMFVVFDNEVTSVLKNPKPGEDCIGK